MCKYSIEAENLTYYTALHILCTTSTINASAQLKQMIYCDTLVQRVPYRVRKSAAQHPHTAAPTRSQYCTMRTGAKSLDMEARPLT